MERLRVAAAQVLVAVFKLDSAGNESILYNFLEPSRRRSPFGSLLRDQAEPVRHYQSGGTSNTGTVFELSPSGSSWTEEVLYD